MPMEREGKTAAKAIASNTRPSDPEPVFLRRLTMLPLVGGSVALVGNPTAVDLKPTPVMLEAYSAWLHYERACLNASFLRLSEHHRPSMGVPEDNDGARFHWPSGNAYLARYSKGDWPEQMGLEAQRRAAPRWC